MECKTFKVKEQRRGSRGTFPDKKSQTHSKYTDLKNNSYPKLYVWWASYFQFPKLYPIFFNLMNADIKIKKHIQSV